jgi:hypothetical protein
VLPRLHSQEGAVARRADEYGGVGNAPPEVKQRVRRELICSAQAVAAEAQRAADR